MPPVVETSVSPTETPLTPAPAAASYDTPHLAAPEVNPSFIRGIFLGEIWESLVFPFPTLEPDERDALHMILGSFREFANAKINPIKHDRDGHFEPEMLKEMHALGLMGLNIDEAYGGFGASAKVFSRVFGEIGSTDPALAVYFGAHQSIGCKGIMLFGTEEQKQRYLPYCATGEMVAGFCLTEPGSGSDAQAMTTTATPTEDGTAYLLNGTKIWISNAGYADLFTVFAKVPVTRDGVQKQRVTAFIVDAHAEGVRLGKAEEKMGIKASDTRAVFFENVRVPAENVLGTVGQGFKIALEILNTGRLGLSAASALAAERVMREAVRYAKQREQFGRPIISFEMIQEKVASVIADCYAADAAWWLTAGMIDRGGIDFSLETAVCKIFASELVNRAANDALQIAGGIGYSKEYPYEQAVRDARINTIFEGTNEVLRALIALSGVEHPGQRLTAAGRAMQHPLRQPGAALGALGEFIGRRARRSFRPARFTRVHPSFAREADRVAGLVAALAGAVEDALRRVGRTILERGFLQKRMADAAIDIYLSTAVLSRVTALLEATSDPTIVRAELGCARTSLRVSADRAGRSIRAIRHNNDPAVSAIAMAAAEMPVLVPPLPGA